MGRGGKRLNKQAFKKFFTKENSLIIILVGVLIMVIAIPVNGTGLFAGKSTKETEQSTEASIPYNAPQVNDKEDTYGGTTMEKTNHTEALKEYQDTLEKRVKDMLEKVEGVGIVDVLIMFNASDEEVILREEGERVVLIEEGEEQVPYIVKVIEPSVKGIAVAADGGDNEYVKKEILDMLQALFGIEINKIKILKRVE